jgi:hypothetical protein
LPSRAYLGRGGNALFHDPQIFHQPAGDNANEVKGEARILEDQFVHTVSRDALQPALFDTDRGCRPLAMRRKHSDLSKDRACFGVDV